MEIFRRIWPWVVIALVLTAGCSSEPAVGPEQALRQFYTHLNEGNYRGAMDLYSAEARSVLSDPDSASDSAFESWAKSETKDGSIDRVDVVRQESSGENAATMDYTVVYRDGTSTRHTVTMTREDGAWKMGLIG